MPSCLYPYSVHWVNLQKSGLCFLYYPNQQLKEKNYSFSAGQYFDVKIEYTDITPKAFTAKMDGFKNNLGNLFSESKKLEREIQKHLNELNYE